jgi:hypothetical protein
VSWSRDGSWWSWDEHSGARVLTTPENGGALPAGIEADLWREERWGAVVPLAGVADDDAELLRQAANGVAAEWADPEAGRLLLDAATVAEIGA